MKITSAGQTDTGCRRKRNEDRILVDDSRKVFVVADGMGGEQCGALAAELAVEGVRDYVMHAARTGAYAWPFGYDPEVPATQNRMLNAVRLANSRVWETCKIRPECSGMGTTITALFINDGTATIGSVGDSRAYLYRDSQLRQLTRDDALVANLVESGEITPEEAPTHPLRNVLTLALGRAPEITVQIVVFTLRPGDRLMLCSDGLHGPVNPRTVHEIVAAPRAPAEVAQALIDAAKSEGAPDNVSCIVIACDSDTES